LVEAMVGYPFWVFVSGRSILEQSTTRHSAAGETLTLAF
jgi:hypothetical protein